MWRCPAVVASAFSAGLGARRGRLVQVVGEHLGAQLQFVARHPAIAHSPIAVAALERAEDPLQRAQLRFDQQFAPLLPVRQLRMPLVRPMLDPVLQPTPARSPHMLRQGEAEIRAFLERDGAAIGSWVAASPEDSGVGVSDDDLALAHDSGSHRS